MDYNPEDCHFLVTTYNGKQSRSLLIRELEVHLGLKSESINVKKNEHGQPFLSCQYQQLGSISFAHSNIIEVLLYSSNYSQIGIDVENNISNHEVIEEFLSEKERLAISKCDEQFEMEATRIWTYKEAFVKALGVGFITHPHNVCVADVFLKDVGQTGTIIYKGRAYMVKIIVQKRIEKGYVSAVAITK
jgi:phosphopantetheinyl transferase